ncbi:unnamed protein product [Symbiodinium sp. CCMP2592]|nr:unnamed protein product [Symbiodinium sp. CCMP2592]
MEVNGVVVVYDAAAALVVQPSVGCDPFVDFIFSAVGGDVKEARRTRRAIETKMQGAGLSTDSKLDELLSALMKHMQKALRGPRALGAALVALARLRGSRAQELRSRCLARAASERGAGPRAEGSARDLANFAWAAATLSEQGQRSGRGCTKTLTLLTLFRYGNLLAILQSSHEYRASTVPGAAVLQHVASEALAGRRSLKSGFEPLDLAQLCWSLGKLQEAPAPLSEALFAAAAQRYAEFAPQGWANIAWACARLCPRGPKSALNCAAKMIAAAAGALRSDPTAFAVQNMSNLAWAAGTLAICDSPFFSSLATACRFAELGAQHVANIAWSFGTVAHQNDQFIQWLSQRAVDIGLATFQPEEFAGFLSALGMLSAAPPMLDAALQEVQRRVGPGQLGATELSGVIWALAALGQDSEAFAAAARAAEDRAAELSPQGVANVFWAFATLEVPWELGTSFPRLSGAAHACSPELVPQGLVNLAWALTVLMAAEAGSGSLEASTLQAVLSRASNLVGSLKTLELAALSWVAARCRADHVSAQARNLEAPLSTEVLQRLAGAEAFEARQLSNLAWAFATMASRATVVEALGRAALPRLEGFSSQGLSNMAWALGCTTVFATGIGERLLRGLAAASAHHGFSPQGLALLAWAFAPDSRMRMDPIPLSPATAKLHLLATIQQEVQVGLRRGSHPRTACDG